MELEDAKKENIAKHLFCILFLKKVQTLSFVGNKIKHNQYK